MNWLIPAILMSFAIPAGQPPPDEQRARIRSGGIGVIVLFALTIAATVAFHQYAHLPPFLGMMTGLGALQIYGYVIRRRELRELQCAAASGTASGVETRDQALRHLHQREARRMGHAAVLLWSRPLCGSTERLRIPRAAVASLICLARGHLVEHAVGIASALIDNIPIMFAVLTMNPDMSHGQWLLVTLTAGVGGSLLSIGSAAGVALMGQARGIYTFFAHLKWTWAIALGYAASIYAHFLINAGKF